MATLYLMYQSVVLANGTDPDKIATALSQVYESTMYGIMSNNRLGENEQVSSCTVCDSTYCICFYNTQRWY